LAEKVKKKGERDVKGVSLGRRETDLSFFAVAKKKKEAGGSLKASCRVRSEGKKKESFGRLQGKKARMTPV